MTRTKRQKMLRAATKRLAATTNRPGCPTPAKRSYANEEAVHKALKGSKYIGRPISMYTCPCGGLHLTKRKQS